MDGFFLKKILGALAMPLPIILFLLSVGVILLFTQKQTLARITLLTATVLLWLSSMSFMPNSLLGALERHFPQYDISIPANQIVVLGCGHANDSQLPITSQLKACSLTRVIEAFRIWQLNQDAVVYTSGYGGIEPFSTAQMHARMLQQLGVPAAQIKMFEDARDTEDEAQLLSAELNGQPFVLVTSASHMLRASTFFTQRGQKPIPAPTDHLIRHYSDSHWWGHLPDASNIQKTERWWYERLGRTWQWLKQAFD